MSYCRWSSDDFKCDLYVYECVDETWTIHVAGRRVVETVPPIRWPTNPEDTDQVADFIADHRARNAFMDTVTHVPIGLPHDGETFKLASPGDCADKCAELIALGYHAPSHVIPDLREEQAEMDATP